NLLIAISSSDHVGEARRAVFQHGARDDGAVDLRGAVEDAEDARVAVEPLDRQILAVSHAAENLHGAVRDPPEHFGGVDFHHRDALARVLAPIDLGRRMEKEEPRRIDLDGAVGEELLNELVLTDRLAELTTLARVVRHRVEDARRLANGARADLCESNSP